jgi:hypothetical protein
LIAYRAMLDVPRELVLELAKLLRAERRALGTRKGARLLTCFKQALFVLVWFRTKGEVEIVGAGFRLSRATSYRYRDEGVRVLAAQAPDLHDALAEVAEQGWSHVVLDGKLIRTDRCAETTTSVKGETINAWYSGKHRAPGGNIQAVMRPDGQPIFVADVAPGHRHDLTVARDTDLIGALNWAASQLDLPTLADSGYDGAGQGIKTPIKQPGLQHPAPRHPLPRRTRLRPAHWPLASTPTSHRQPPPGRRTRPSRARAQPNRKPSTTHFLLRSPQ